MTGYAKTAVLLAGLTGLFMAVGFLLGGQGGMLIAFVIALGMNAFAYWNSDASCCANTARVKSLRRANHSCTRWWHDLPSAPICRCRAFT